MTTIDWTDATLNPWAGCDIVSSGCTNCYAMRAARRLEGFGNPTYAGTTRSSKAGPIWSGRLNRASDAQFRRPLDVCRPTTCFREQYVGRRPRERARRLAGRPLCRHARGQLAPLPDPHQTPRDRGRFLCHKAGDPPPANVWLGVSVERADVRRRFLSVAEAKATDLAASSKGGATLDGKLWREMPPKVPYSRRQPTWRAS
jgi:hypothetical protein